MRKTTKERRKFVPYNLVERDKPASGCRIPFKLTSRSAAFKRGLLLFVEHRQKDLL
ncbi:MAG: hypothetical protein IPG58_19670 [Acidobacteria bacterium]|nr:hypothetical protein [Acidobacteriota bacterium]